MRRQVELPDDSTIKRWKLEEKLTYQQMVERWYEMTEGRELAKPGAFAMRCSRRGWTKPQRVSTDLIPWVVEDRHQHMHHIQMLRYEAKRRAGDDSIPAKKLKDLASFLSQRLQKQTVIHYEPNSAEGFWDIPREWFDTDIIRDPDLMPLSGTPDPGTPTKRKNAIARAKKAALV